MTIAVSLIGLFGKPLADGLIKAFTNRKNGQTKLNVAADAMAKGASAIEALRQAFGKEFLPALNEALSAAGAAPIGPDAGSLSYITLDGGQPLTVGVLREEASVNLNRVAGQQGDLQAVLTQFRANFANWKKRCLELAGTLDAVGIEPALTAIENLPSDKAHSYRQVFERLSGTPLGGLVTVHLITESHAKGGFISALAFLFCMAFAAATEIPWIIVSSWAIAGLVGMIFVKRGVAPKKGLSIAVSATEYLLMVLEKAKKKQPQLKRMEKRMHCRNCGKEIDDKAVVCVHCGVPPKAEKKFCHNCGVATNANQTICTSCGVALKGGSGKKKKSTLLLLGLFLGTVGAHKFYMGSWGWGIVYLVLSITLVFIWVPLIVSFVEDIRLIMMSDEEFDSKVAQFEGSGPFGFFW